MSLSAVQIVENRLILPSFNEEEVAGQKAGIRLHTSGTWFFKAINYAYDVQINGTTYTLNADSFAKWQKRVNAKLIKPLPLNSDINSKTIQSFLDSLFAPLPPIPHLSQTPALTTSTSHPSLSPDHVVNNPSSYSTHLYGSPPKESKAERYARLAKEKKAQEHAKVQKDLAALKKAKQDGTLHQQPAPTKKQLTEEERAQTKYFLGLANLSD